MSTIERERALIIGWFSFPNSYATAGDVVAAKTVRDWLASSNIHADIATDRPFTGGISTADVCAAEYKFLIAVCGPHFPGALIKRLPGNFTHCKYIGIDLSILEPIDQTTSLEFDMLFERDSNRMARPDLVFASPTCRVPIVGLILVHPQPEYGRRAWHELANSHIKELLDKQQAAVIKIDTLLVDNVAGFQTSEQIENAIMRMDCVVTTRLHGTVFALKHGIPVLAVDPISGGAKITAQCKVIGWPVCFAVEHLEVLTSQQGLDYCLSTRGRIKAAECAAVARRSLEQLRREFLAVFRDK